MIKLPNEHKKMLTITLFIAVVAIFLYYFFIQPIATDVNSKKSIIADKKSKLSKTKWPLDVQRLTKLLEMKHNELVGTNSTKFAKDATGIKQRANLVLSESTKMFDNRIKKLFKEPADFLDEASRLDYQEEFNMVEDVLATRGIFVAEEVLNLSEDTNSAHIYQLILQIWGVDFLTKIVSENQMRFAKSDITVKNVNGKMIKVSKIKVMPVKKCFLYESSGVYLYEFPYKIVLHGKASNLNKLLSSLQKEGNFIPVSNFQIFVPPLLIKRGSSIYIEPGTMTVELVCSFFFRKPNSKGLQIHKKKIIKLIPRGT